MSDLRAIADLVEIEALRGEFSDAVMMNGYTATGRAYLSELARGRDGSSHLNYFVYHDRYQRTPDGWKFTERISEFRYLDTSPLGGAPPGAAGAPGLNAGT